MYTDKTVIIVEEQFLKTQSQPDVTLIAINIPCT